MTGSTCQQRFQMTHFVFTQCKFATASLDLVDWVVHPYVEQENISFAHDIKILWHVGVKKMFSTSLTQLTWSSSGRSNTDPSTLSLFRVDSRRNSKLPSHPEQTYPSGINCEPIHRKVQVCFSTHAHSYLNGGGRVKSCWSISLHVYCEGGKSDRVNQHGHMWT